MGRRQLAQPSLAPSPEPAAEAAPASRRRVRQAAPSAVWRGGGGRDPSRAVPRWPSYGARSATEPSYVDVVLAEPRCHSQIEALAASRRAGILGGG